MNLAVVEATIGTIVNKYKTLTPVATRVVNTLNKDFQYPNIYLDHLAFRSFDFEGLGIESTGSLLKNLGFKQGEYFYFVNKKLKATWFAPPTEYYAHVPRIFVSEIKVKELSPEVQKIITTYAHPQSTSLLTPATLLSSVITGSRPWAVPRYDEYLTVARESEYAAWVLVHGYALNHFALATHRMVVEGPAPVAPASSPEEGIVSRLTVALQTQHGFKMNTEGGLVKKSPDGFLLQTSTLADNIELTFKDGDKHAVSGSYVEFVERKVLPQFAHLPNQLTLTEQYRRDGFETDSADKIFESTYVKGK